MSGAPANVLKARLAEGAYLRGCWLAMGSPVAAEAAATCGFDWLLIDGEHAPYDIGAVAAQLRATASSAVPTAVRVPWHEIWLAKQVLDLGVQTVMFPNVATPEQAAECVAACRYPPAGRRGVGASNARASDYGARAAYIPTADEEICVIVQIETRAALDNLEAICRVDGVDCAFVGPSDLSADHGHLTAPFGEEMCSVHEDTLRRIRATGTAAGFLDFAPAREGRWRDAGANMMAVTSDLGAMTGTLRAAAKVD